MLRGSSIFIVQNVLILNHHEMNQNLPHHILVSQTLMTQILTILEAQTQGKHQEIQYILIKALMKMSWFMGKHLVLKVNYHLSEDGLWITHQI